MITFNNKAAKEHYLDILVSLVDVPNLKLKKPNLKQIKHKKSQAKGRYWFLCITHTLNSRQLLSSRSARYLFILLLWGNYPCLHEWNISCTVIMHGNLTLKAFSLSILRGIECIYQCLPKITHKPNMWWDYNNMTRRRSPTFSASRWPKKFFLL